METSIENIQSSTMMSINELLKGEISDDTRTTTSGWVRTLRTSSSILAFCNMNDGSCPSGLQVIISNSCNSYNSRKFEITRIITIYLIRYFIKNTTIVFNYTL